MTRARRSGGVAAQAGKRLLRGIDGSGDFRRAGERHARLDAAQRRIEHVAEAPAGSGDFLAADEVMEFFQDRGLVEWLVHVCFPSE